MSTTGVHSENEPDCKGCQRVVRLKEDELARILSEFFQGNPVETADGDTYAQRLAVCGSCPDLQYGTTCRHCGCLVAVRAKISAKKCPAMHPKW